MKHLLIGVTAAITIAAIGQVWAQVPPPGTQPPQLASAAAYPLDAPAPEDAYRDGLINRWQLEQLTGPMPQALMGPSVNGNRNGDDGGRQ